MSKFTDRLRDYGLTLEEDVIICDRRVVDEAADIIDELDQALRESLYYVAKYESENFSNVALTILTRGDDALTKLERL